MAYKSDQKINENAHTIWTEAQGQKWEIQMEIDQPRLRTTSRERDKV